MRGVRGAVGKALSIAVMAILAGCSAPPGYHYAVLGTKLIPNDPCLSPQVRSAGAMNYLNAKVGRFGGPPGVVVAIRDPKEPPGIAESPHHLLCHATLVMRGGKTQSGIISVVDPGGTRPLHVSWRSDQMLAQNIQTQDKKEEERARSIYNGREKRGRKCKRDAKSQIPLILGLGKRPRIQNVSGFINESIAGEIKCYLKIHWSNGLVEGGTFREWRNDYGKVMVGWQRDFAIPPNRQS